MTEAREAGAWRARDVAGVIIAFPLYLVALAAGFVGMCLLMYAAWWATAGLLGYIWRALAS